jgi:hypothetical protein
MGIHQIIVLLSSWLLVCMGGLPFALPAQLPQAEAIAEAEQVITPALLAGPIRFLSDDHLEGRGPGTRGDSLARLYIATQMQSLNLHPGAAGGHWEQPVELVGMEVMHAIRKGQLEATGTRPQTPAEQFYALAV